MALLADQFRHEHENAIKLKHHEETIVMLRDLVSLQNDTIAEWKARHHDLHNAVVRMTGNAKTHKEYAAGLQKDYEKLQELATSFHVQSKKTLQEKIAEVESEKESLRRDFEVTLNVLGKSQANLKATLEDLCVRLRSSELKRIYFAQSLSKQTAMYEEERRKRDDLEKQLLLSVQSTQRQLGDASTALVGKLEALQSSIYEVVATDRNQETGMKECLKALQSIQGTRVLTVKDLQKAEGMLRFVHERYV